MSGNINCKNGSIDNFKYPNTNLYDYRPNVISNVIIECNINIVKKTIFYTRELNALKYVNLKHQFNIKALHSNNIYTVLVNAGV